MKSRGKKYDSRGERGRADGHRDLPGALDGRLDGFHALAAQPEDVLEDHDGVVHQHADAEHQSHQGHDIERQDLVARIDEIHGRERDQDGCRYGSGDDEGRPVPSQEEEQHAHGEQPSPHPGVAEGFQRSQDPGGLLEEDVVGQAGPSRVSGQLVQRFPDGGRNVHGVGIGFLADDHPDGVLAVEAGAPEGRGFAVSHFGDVPKPKTPFVDGERLDVFDGLERAREADEVAETAVVHVSPRRVHVRLVHGPDEQIGIHPIGLQSILIHIDDHLPRLGTPRVDTGDAVQPFETGPELLVNHLEQRILVSVPRHGEEHDGNVGRGKLPYPDAVNVVGQPGSHPLHAVAGFHVGQLHVGVVVEAQIDVHPAGPRVGFHANQSAQRLQFVLQGPGDQLYVVLGRGIGIGDPDVHARPFDRGDELQRKQPERNQTEEDRADQHHENGHRPAKGEGGPVGGCQKFEHRSLCMFVSALSGVTSITRPRPLFCPVWYI